MAVLHALLPWPDLDLQATACHSFTILLWWTLRDSVSTNTACHSWSHESAFNIHSNEHNTHLPVSTVLVHHVSGIKQQNVFCMSALMTPVVYKIHGSSEWTSAADAYTDLFGNEYSVLEKLPLKHWMNDVQEGSKVVLAVAERHNYCHSMTWNTRSWSPWAASTEFCVLEFQLADRRRFNSGDVYASNWQTTNNYNIKLTTQKHSSITFTNTFRNVSQNTRKCILCNNWLKPINQTATMCLAKDLKAALLTINPQYKLSFLHWQADKDCRCCKCIISTTREYHWYSCACSTGYCL